MIEVPRASSAPVSVIDELERILSEYLKSRPHMSLSAVSRRSKVSEPTLRRIKNKQFRTLPTHTTILNFLTYMSGETSIPRIIETYRGPIAEYLKESIPQQSFSAEYDVKLNNLLKDNTAYCIFKLCASSSGVSSRRVLRLFGEVGLHSLKSLEANGYVTVKEGVYYSSVEWFILDPEQINEKFQFLSQFIKIQPNIDDPYLRSIHGNYNCSVTPEAYRNIAKLQGKFLKKVRDIIEDDSSHGSIPLMLLSALDTLDSKSPSEDFSQD